MNIARRYEIVPLDRIIPYARNSRTHSPEQVAQIRASFREFGVLAPCLVDESYNLIAGHGRLVAARAENLTEINCVVVEGLTDAQKRAYILADNRLALNADWDDAMLSVELADLQTSDFNVSLLGFDDAELNKLLGLAGNVRDDAFDLSAALEEAAFVLPGDVWTVGRHRLMCGDATKPEDVARLMDGRKANLLLTDPPYSVSYKSANGMSIKNDGLKDKEFYNFLLSSFKNMADSLEPGGSAYVFHADTAGLSFRKAFVDAGFHLSGVCIWAKDSFVMGRSPYQWQHEPILYGWLKNGKHKWYAGRSEKTVWNFAKPKHNENHPTSKPLDLMAYPICNSSQPNGIVLDLFGGSGSTMISCEQCDRICFMMELDEKYASVILRRYVEVKGGGSEDVSVERGGQTFRYSDLVREAADSG